MNIYTNELKKAAMNNYAQIICGAQLVEVYKDIAKKNGRKISMNHVPLNVHKWAKRNGIALGKIRNANGKLTTIYYFNFK
jgi:hypothetical protein